MCCNIDCFSYFAILIMTSSKFALFLLQAKFLTAWLLELSKRQRVTDIGMFCKRKRKRNSTKIQFLEPSPNDRFTEAMTGSSFYQRKWLHIGNVTKVLKFGFIQK
ncbi:unnamed protein product [Rhizopus microsporus]